MIIKKFKPKDLLDKSCKTKFAFLPRQDVYGNWFWLEKFYVTGDFITWIANGRVKDFSSKKDFYCAVMEAFYDKM